MKPASRRLEPNLRLKLDSRRSTLALAVCFIGFTLLLGRALQLQVLESGFLRAKGESRFVRVVDLPASRGAIMDRHGKPLAISTPVESIWASPAELKADAAQLASLATALGIDEKSLATRVADKSRDFVWLKRQLPPEEAKRAMQLKLEGVFQQREYRRYYPAGDVAAHVIGFTGLTDEGIDDKGLEGIELAQQATLAGAVGKKSVIRDKKGRIVEDIQNIRAPRDGKPLNLSLDERFQNLAHRELKTAVDLHKAKGGALVMLDAKTGEVLALVNQPDFNPNNRKNVSLAQMRNSSVTDVFEPGSTFKPFTVSAALEAGIVTPETIITTGPGLTVGPKTFTDLPHRSTQLSVAEIIQQSSNIGTAKLALKLPSETLWSLYSALGFGAFTQSGFPGERRGHLTPLDKSHGWKPIEQATMAFGLGVSVSAIQLARAYTIFTNDGVLLPVTFLKRESDVIGRQVISKKTANSMAKMLETVTQAGGTAKKGQVSGYRIAGKTGTAHKYVRALGRYSETHYTSSFVGYGPATNPRYIIAVVIDEPGAGLHFGGDVSAPVFSNVMTQALRMSNVMPDAEDYREASAPSTVKERG